MTSSRSGRSSLGDLDPLGRLDRLEPLAFARYFNHIFHWRSYRIGLAVLWRQGQRADRARHHFSRSTTVHAMLVKLDAVRQSVDRIANNIVTNQEQMTRSVSQLRASRNG